MKSKLTLFLLIVPLLAWGVFGVFGERVAVSASSRYGARILASGDGKFTNPQVFVKGLLRDSVCIVSAACVLALVYRQGSSIARRRLAPPARWVVQGWSAFVCLNLLVAVSEQTVLFWCVLYSGKESVNNYTQWRIKRALLSQVEAPSQAVLLGASQTRAQIDTKVLNECLDRKLWTTELHFPGSSPYDAALCLERLPTNHLDLVITYLSEADFYASGVDDRLMYFFGLRDLPAYWTFGPGKPAVDQYLISGVLADMMPVYQVWDSLNARVHGAHAVNQKQQEHDASLETDLAARARRLAPGYHFGPTADFNKRSLVRLAQMCRERHCRLVMCCGQVNPVLGRALDPALRCDMVAFLRGLAREDSNIVLIDESQLPPQVATDYEDLTHVDLAARARFSKFLAQRLQDLAAH